jgi:hypothetical protein
VPEGDDDDEEDSVYNDDNDDRRGRLEATRDGYDEGVDGGGGRKKREPMRSNNA